MTEAIAFDTHRFVKRLTEDGFTERQAETLAEEHVTLLNANIETLREETKASFAEVKAEITGCRAEITGLKVQIEAMRADLLKWLLSAMVVQGGTGRRLD